MEWFLVGYDVLISVIGGIIGGLISIVLAVRYTTKAQMAIRINENLEKCIVEILKNKG